MARATRAAARLLRIGPLLRTALRRALVLLAGAAPAAGFRRLAWSIGLLLLITITGLIGYRLISGFSWFDALYQVVLTLTTVGFREVHPLDEAGRAFTVGLAVVGVTTGLYLMAAAAATLLEGDLYGDLRSWRMTRELAALEGHVIVAGAGRVGRGVISELIRRRPFAIIDTDQREVEQHRLAGRLAVQGDASRRETLLEARLLQARALVVATGSDAQNTFITLSALGLDPQCYVVARSNEPEAAAPLRQAGAARVFTPTEIVGRQLAAASLYPGILEAAENVLELPGAPDVLLRLEVDGASAVQGLSESEALDGVDGAQLLGIRRAADGQFSVGGGDQRLSRGDALLVLTPPNAVDALEQRWSRHADDPV